MTAISAIGFDLFDTLITVRPIDPDAALDRLMECVAAEGFSVPRERFGTEYRDAVRRRVDASLVDGRETHNRYWIGDALAGCGVNVSPHDPRVEGVVNRYFTTFDPYIELLPGTRELLASLRGRYRIGLLSNFTDGPAGRAILERFELMPFFDAVLISGEVGYRKPHPTVFERLLAELEVAPEELLFIGDNVSDDIAGARKVGIRPVWTSYVFQLKGRFSRRLSDEAPARPPDGTLEIRNWDDLRALLGDG